MCCFDSKNQNIYFKIVHNLQLLHFSKLLQYYWKIITNKQLVIGDDYVNLILLHYCIIVGNKLQSYCLKPWSWTNRDFQGVTEVVAGVENGDTALPTAGILSEKLWGRYCPCHCPVPERSWRKIRWIIRWSSYKNCSNFYKE